MSTLVSCHGLSKSYGAQALFEGLDLHLEPGERLGIIGANGTGKSTLLKILAGQEDPDQGQRMVTKGLRVGMVAQDPTFQEDQNVGQALLQALMDNPVDPTEDEVEQQVRVGRIISRMDFEDAQAPVITLSGGWQKRLAIGQALICEPQLLLLDEPTNHLDLESILWLEDLLSQGRFAFAVISHDRVFLERVTTRVAELDSRFPGGLLSVTGGYQRFVELRADFLSARAKQKETLVNKVRREQEWLRRGPKARTTKAHGRIKEAELLMAELQRLSDQDQKSSTQIDLNATGRRSKRLLVLKGVSKTLSGQKLISDLTLLLRPKMRLGLLGRNGSGKTTLLRLMSGDLEPDQGVVRQALDLKVVTFEQKRDALNPKDSLKRALAPEGDSVLYRDRSIHVVSWAKRFGFTTEQLEQPVSRLSGGEKAKVAIAQLMLRPADLLMLDEPTNDLDLPTLQILEESLLEFPGALVLVTHDRAMLDRISTIMLGLDGLGQATPLADTAQWTALLKASRAKSKDANKPEKAKTAKPKKKGLGYLEQREFDGLEDRIAQAEELVETTQAKTVDPAIASDAPALAEACTTLQQAELELEKLYERWSELDDKSSK